jgi:hypothetical protein
MRRYLSALVSLFLLIVSPALAAQKHGIIATNLPPIAASGQLVLNIGGAFNGGTGNDSPFRNFFKLWAWSSSSCDPAIFGPGGYPASTASLSSACSAQINSIPDHWGGAGTDWVLKWTGKLGDNSNSVGLQLSFPTTVTSTSGSGCAVTAGGSGSGNTNVYGTACRFAFNSTAALGSPTVIFRSTGVYDGTLSNIILIPAAWESAWDRGDYYNPDLISLIKTSMKAHTLRYLNYANTNGEILTNYADARVASDMSWSGDHFKSSLYAGATGGTNTDYTITKTGFAYTDGATIQLKFNAANGTCSGGANPPNCTLNVNNGTVNLGAVTLRQAGTTPVTVAGTIPLNSYWTCVYNTLLSSGSFVCQQGGLGDGIPLSVMVGLSNATNTDFWLPVSAYGNVPYFTALVADVKAQLNTTLNFIAEFGNEVWISRTALTSYARSMGAALGFPNPANDEALHGFYSLRTRQLAKEVETGFGAQTNYKRALMWQFADSTTNVSHYRMASQDLNGAVYPTYCAFVGGSYSGGVCTGDPGYNLVGNRAFDHADYGGYAPYYQGANLQDIDDHYLSLETTANGSNVRFTINAAASVAGPITRFTTSASHGYTAGQAINLGTFSNGTWAAQFNNTAWIIASVTSTTIDINADSSGLSAFSGTALVQRYGDDMVLLKRAADEFNSGSFSAAQTDIDNDIRSGTNYGVVGGGGLGQATLSAHNGSGTGGNYAQWAAVLSDASWQWAGTQRIVTYENAMQGQVPGRNDFTGVISGNTLTTSARSGQTLTAGMMVTGAGVASGTILVSTADGVVWTIGGPSQTVASESMTASTCDTLLGAGNSNYCGTGGLIYTSANSYKRSSMFQATVTCQWNQQLAVQWSLYATWYELAATDQWALYTGDIYSNSFSSLAAFEAYPASGAGSPGC